MKKTERPEKTYDWIQNGRHQYSNLNANNQQAETGLYAACPFEAMGVTARI